MVNSSTETHNARANFSIAAFCGVCWFVSYRAIATRDTPDKSESCFCVKPFDLRIAFKLFGKKKKKIKITA